MPQYMDTRENRLVRLDVPAAESSFVKAALPLLRDLIAGNQDCPKPTTAVRALWYPADPVTISLAQSCSRGLSKGDTMEHGPDNGSGAE